MDTLNLNKLRLSISINIQNSWVVIYPEFQENGTHYGISNMNLKVQTF